MIARYQLELMMAIQRARIASATNIAHIFCTSLVTAFIITGSAQSETLLQALSATYETHPALLAARAALRAEDEAYIQGRAAFGPTITANFEGDYQDAKIDELTVQGHMVAQHLTSPTNTSEAELTQPLYTGGKLTDRGRVVMSMRTTLGRSHLLIPG